ncbi:MAG: aminotransferase class V-fold PLP-dependent enzyme [Streptosporangiaceae bacterium]
MDVRALWDPEAGYLNTANYGLPPRPAFDAMQAALGDWRTGRSGWEPWDESVGRSREIFARLVGVDQRDVTVGATVSQLLGQVATALPAGARIVCPEEEFTSNLFPWFAGRDAEVQTLPAARLAEAVDARTTLVAFSLVQSATGEIAPYDEIIAAANHHGVLVTVDATQSCGWLPFDARRVDAYAAHAYKWLMSPRGSAFLATSPRLRSRMRPFSAGWYAGEDVHASYYGPPPRLADDARRFDISPAWFSWVGTAPALETVERLGIKAIHDHDVGLANRLRKGLGLDQGDSAIVSVEVPDAMGRLRRAGVTAAVRAGYARMSCHVYTTEHDVDMAIDALSG